MPSSELVDAHDTATAMRNLETLLQRRERIVQSMTLGARHEWVDGPSEQPVLNIDVAIAAAQHELAWMQALDAAEVDAWGSESWLGAVSLTLPGMSWLVTIAPFCTDGHFGASVGFDGKVRSYLMTELDAAARSSYCDDAERTMWALVARRVRHAIRETLVDRRDW